MSISKFTIQAWSMILQIQDYLANLTYSHELSIFASCIILIGILGFVESHEFLSILINVEIIMIGINFYLITLSLSHGDYFGQMYALCFLAVTAAETAIGLGLLILLYRAKGYISFMEFGMLKG